MTSTAPMPTTHARRNFNIALSCVVAIFASSALACDGDLNANETVDAEDLAQMLSSWGTANGDIDGNGTTDAADLATLLSNWGACPPVVQWSLLTRLDSATTTAVDASGVVVRTWTGTSNGASVAYLRADGSLIRPGVFANGSFTGAGRGGRLQIFSPAGVLTNDLIIASALFQQHHDVCPLPNGNILCIVWDLHTQAEAIAAGRTTITGNIYSERIIEVHPTGMNTYDIAWSWSVWDHLIQDANAAAANFGVVATHPELVDINFGAVMSSDWIHMNAIDYNATRNEIVVSSRSFNELWVIDHSTTTAQAATHSGGARGKGGDLLYRWGNPLVSRRGTTTDQFFRVVHGVTWIDEGMPGAGNILSFNNGDRTGTTNDWSQLVEIAPPRDKSGGYIVPATSAFGPTAPLWSVGGVGGFYGGPTQCGAFRQSNGNTLVTLTNSGTLFEVNAVGATVSTTQLTGQVARVPRYRFVNGVWQGH